MRVLCAHFCLVPMGRLKNLSGFWKGFVVVNYTTRELRINLNY